MSAEPNHAVPSAPSEAANPTNPTNPTNIDARLVARARIGDQSAWTALVERYTPVLWWTVRHYHLRDSDAADVVQETWLKLVESLDRLREPDRVGGWLATTCRRGALRTLRRNARYLPVDTSDPVASLLNLPDYDAAVDPVEVVLHQELSAALRQAIAALPDRQQRVLRELIRQENRPDYAEAAASLAMPVGSLGPTRQRALCRLRRNPRVRRLHAQAS
jgi:RNA polymerase sigma factor (sigma-70 family)